MGNFPPLQVFNLVQFNPFHSNPIHHHRPRLNHLTNPSTHALSTLNPQRKPLQILVIFNVRIDRLTNNPSALVAVFHSPLLVFVVWCFGGFCLVVGGDVSFDCSNPLRFQSRFNSPVAAPPRPTPRAKQNQNTNDNKRRRQKQRKRQNIHTP